MLPSYSVPSLPARKISRCIAEQPPTPSPPSHQGSSSTASSSTPLVKTDAAQQPTPRHKRNASRFRGFLGVSSTCASSPARNDSKAVAAAAGRAAEDAASAPAADLLFQESSASQVPPALAAAVPPAPPSPLRRRLTSAVTGLSQKATAWGWIWFRSEYFAVLAVFAPVCIASGAAGWSPQLVFALGALSLAGLEVLIGTSLERVCLPRARHQLAAAIGLELVPIVFPTMIGIVALVASEIAVAKSFVIGNVLNNILLGTGAALFIGGLKPSTASYAEDIGDSSFELVKLTMFSTSPIVMTWAMIYVMKAQAVLPLSEGSRRGNSTATTSENDSTQDGIARLSRGTAVLLLAVFFSWMFFRRVTHRASFAGDDRAREAAAAALRKRKPGGWPTSNSSRPAAGEKALQKQPQRPVDWQRVQPGPRTHSRPFWTLSIAAKTGGLFGLLGLAAAFAMAIFCCHYLVVSIDPLVSGTTSPSSLQRHFIASILLPLIVNLYNYVRAAELASCGGHDVSLAVQLTYGAGVGSLLLTLPLLVLVGWAAGKPLLLDFSAFDVAILAGGVWASSVLTTSHVEYFRGFVFVCLYVITALAIFLFKN